MNIPANHIVHHIEEKFTSLKKGLESGDEKTVRECATAIEAYCQLLKGAQQQIQTRQEPIMHPQAYPTSSPQPSSQPLIVNQPSAQEEAEKRNLLDF